MVARYLSASGSDLNATTKKGVASLHWATWGGSIPVVEWVLGQGVDIETLSNAGCNCAVWAAAAGRLDMCKWLHEQGSDFKRVNYWGTSITNYNIAPPLFFLKWRKIWI